METMKTMEASVANGDIDYTLANPDTLTKYKQAGQISQKVLQAVSGKDVILPMPFPQTRLTNG
jgi:hypothetical protein